MKSVFSVMVPALLLMSTSAFAADPALQPSGGKADPAISAGTNGLQGSVTGQGYMNGPAGNGAAGNGAAMNNSSSVAANGGMSGDTSSMSATAQTSAQMSADNSPTYAGGRKDYRRKSEASLNASEAQITAQLNQQASQSVR